MPESESKVHRKFRQKITCVSTAAMWEATWPSRRVLARAIRRRAVWGELGERCGCREERRGPLSSSELRQTDGPNVIPVQPELDDLLGL